MMYRDLFNINPKISYEGSPMLFTGIEDRKGVDIYSGDLVRFEGKTFSIRYEPHQAGGFALFGFVPAGDVIIEPLLIAKMVDWEGVKGREVGDIFFDLVVIGNIYENKDLLNEN